MTLIFQSFSILLLQLVWKCLLFKFLLNILVLIQYVTNFKTKSRIKTTKIFVGHANRSISMRKRAERVLQQYIFGDYLSYIYRVVYLRSDTYKNIYKMWNWWWNGIFFEIFFLFILCLLKFYEHAKVYVN